MHLAVQKKTPKREHAPSYSPPRIPPPPRRTRALSSCDHIPTARPPHSSASAFRHLPAAFPDPRPRILSPHSRILLVQPYPAPTPAPPHSHTHLASHSMAPTKWRAFIRFVPTHSSPFLVQSCIPTSLSLLLAVVFPDVSVDLYFIVYLYRASNQRVLI
ncbi:hypothetical protein DFH09DRAFT_378611 [Mycena vulgaris]|nr:hypothetical protein DFH09DRAFT_378611 [Mycena vulgaris]